MPETVKESDPATVPPTDHCSVQLPTAPTPMVPLREKLPLPSVVPTVDVLDTPFCAAVIVTGELGVPLTETIQASPTVKCPLSLDVRFWMDTDAGIDPPPLAACC